MVFKKSLLSSSIAMTVAATSTATSHAQEQAVEEVVVTGIRGSLMRAMDVKRDAKGVVDAISAEDIGKFPDTNLAESLQRITGVSIDRDRGEGARVTVRGFGPDFNLVTLNGRQMPTQSAGGRSFDFGNIASEGVAGVEVYKTGKAHVPTGGIGATINVLTTKPLKNPGLKATVGLKGVHDTSTDTGDSLTPEISGLFSNTFADDTFGVALTLSYQERHSGANSAGTPNGWTPCLGEDPVAGAETQRCISEALPDDEFNINRPEAGEIYAVPQNVNYTIGEFRRERVNGQLTVQWEPVEALTATVDYTIAELSVDQRIEAIGGWFDRAGIQSEYTDGPIASPIFYSASGGSDFTSSVNDSAFKNENESVGFNVEFRPNDNLTLTFDYHDSSAENGPDSPLGNNVNFNISAYIRDRTTVYYDNELPIMELTTNDPLTPDDYFVSGSQFNNDFAKMNIEQARFDATWEFDEGGSIDFGVQTTEVDNRYAGSIVERGAWSGVGNRGQIADLLRPASIAGKFDQISGGDDPRLFTEYYTYDIADVIALMEAAQQLPEDDPNYIPVFPGISDPGDCGTGFCPSSNFSRINNTLEESFAYYFQVNMESALGDHEVSLSAGLRYEETDVSSEATRDELENIQVRLGSANEFDATRVAGAGELTTFSGSYDFILPSMDFSVDITEDIVFRASYSQTIGRPGFGDIQGGLAAQTRFRVDGVGDATAGNPGLLPLESQNYDFSLEWYYGDASYASIGYFRKDTKNFKASEETREILYPDLAHPALGPLWRDATAALPDTASNNDILQYIIDNFPDEPGVDAVNGVLSGVPGRDDPAQLDVVRTANLDEALIDGWEIALQHNFGESGFGFIFNYTFVDGDFGYDPALPEAQFALPGLSDTANVIAFYDKDGLQARVAYNYRDKFLTFAGIEPGFTENYEQWDVNASYEISDVWTVFVEGLNVTDEINRSHARTVNQVAGVTQTGPRFNIGVRASF